MSSVIDSLLPRPMFEAKRRGEACPTRAAIEAELDAHGVEESPAVAARAQADWHGRTFMKPCAGSSCCEEVARFEAEARAPLTPAHQARAGEWRDEWLRIGCDTAPAERPRAEAAIAALYRDAGAEPPPFVWVDSPAAAAGVFLAAPEPGELLGLRLTHPVRDGERIDDSLDCFLRIENEAAASSILKIEGQLRPRLRDQLGRCVAAALVARVGARFPGVAAWEGPAFTTVPRGQHEAYWIAAHTFARDVVGAWYPRLWSRRLDLWAELARACNRFWPFERYCVIAERPSAIAWDPAGRLHGAGSPAVSFRDGSGCYVWHGTWVPPAWIEAPERVDPRRLLTWPHVEQRRAAAEIVGWRRILEAFNPVTVDKDPDPSIGELLELELPGAGAARFLRVRCGTGREFVLSVPREMRTALEANAWTYGLGPAEFKLEARA
jgi:hypothetical protein